MRASANSTTKPRANSSIEMVSSQVNLFDFSAANQNQSGKCIFNPRISHLARKMAGFTESTLSFGRAYL